MRGENTVCGRYGMVRVCQRESHQHPTNSGCLKNKYLQQNFTRDVMRVQCPFSCGAPVYLYWFDERKKGG